MGWKCRERTENSSSCANVLHRTLNLVISRRHLGDDGKEMYQNVKRMCRACRAIVFAHLTYCFVASSLPSASSFRKLPNISCIVRRTFLCRGLINIHVFKQSFKQGPSGRVGKRGADGDDGQVVRKYNVTSGVMIQNCDSSSSYSVYLADDIQTIGSADVLKHLAFVNLANDWVV